MIVTDQKIDRHDPEHRVPGHRYRMRVGRAEHGLDRVDRARTDVTEHHAERPQDQRSLRPSDPPLRLIAVAHWVPGIHEAHTVHAVMGRGLGRSVVFASTPPRGAQRSDRSARSTVGNEEHGRHHSDRPQHVAGRLGHGDGTNRRRPPHGQALSHACLPGQSQPSGRGAGRRGARPACLTAAGGTPSPVR